MKKQWIICDIDGTVSNNDDRNDMLDKNPVDWDLYHRLSASDPPIVPIVQLVSQWFVKPETKIAFVTGRSVILGPSQKNGYTMSLVYCRNIMNSTCGELGIIARTSRSRQKYILSTSQIDLYGWYWKIEPGLSRCGERSLASLASKSRMEITERENERTRDARERR